MNTELLLTALKTDLGIRTDVYDNRLLARITVAQQRLGGLGITLADTEEDNDLVLMYAAWLWRSRVSGEGMPRMLRYALNNRVLGPAAEVAP